MPGDDMNILSITSFAGCMKDAPVVRFVCVLLGFGLRASGDLG